MIKRLTDVSKKLRQESTEAEKRLWSRLRAKQIEAFKFRRQQQIGNYIVDFVCFDRGLIIELDGGQHATDIEKDKQRDDWLRSEGFEVVRFWNTDVFENIEGVMETIRKRLLTPSLGPSHKGREDEKVSPTRGGKTKKSFPQGEGSRNQDKTVLSEEIKQFGAMSS